MQSVLYSRQYTSVMLFSMLFCHKHKSTGNVVPWGRIFCCLCLYVNKTWFFSTNRTFISFIFRAKFKWLYWSCEFALIPRTSPKLKNKAKQKKHSDIKSGHFMRILQTPSHIGGFFSGIFFSFLFFLTLYLRKLTVELI